MSCLLYHTILRTVNGSLKIWSLAALVFSQGRCYIIIVEAKKFSLVLTRTRRSRIHRMPIAITATRNVRFVEPHMWQAFKVLESSSDTFGSAVIVGACRGGDCQAASIAIASGFTVHTVVPGDRSQLCTHWNEYFRSVPLDPLVSPPHTTTFELMPTGSGSAAYRARNTRMVELGSDGLLAFADTAEQQMYSGVTMTINIARRMGRSVSTVILHE
jgi:hypothetical protein